MTSVSLVVEIKETLTFNDVLLSPQYSTVVSRKDVDTSSFFSRNIKLKIPIVSANMDTVTESSMAIAMGSLGGLGVIHRFLTIDEQVGEVRLVKARNLICAAAVGVVGDYFDRCDALVNAGADALVVDVAHGHASHVIAAIKSIKKRHPHTELVAGNVATREGVEHLACAGADGVKLGVGPGAVCSTRVVTGCGVPQLSAIMDASKAAMSIPIIADGGIKNSGDITKALAAGASTVMIGGLFAGTLESPGATFDSEKGLVKVYRGMASREAASSRRIKEGRDTITPLAPEGVAVRVPVKESVDVIVDELVGGLRSGMSYCGAHNLEQLKRNAIFLKITPASWQESIPVGD